MRIVFAGTPEYAVAVAKFLSDECSDHELVAVYTPRDRVAGRGRRLTSSPVKQWAQVAGHPVEQPQVWDAAACRQLASYQPDLMIVAAYGLLLPPCALRTPRLGCVNVHASLLPRWRGAAPVVRAIECGDRMTGISLMKMGAGLDDGPVISVAQCPIKADDTAAALTARLFGLAAEVLKEFLADAEAALDKAVPQAADGVCYAHKVETAESWIDWRQDADAVARKIRALNSAPVARTHFRDTVLRLWNAEVHAAETEFGPGQIAVTEDGCIIVACGTGAVRLTQVQLAGRKVMIAGDFANGYNAAGEVLG